MNFQQLRSFREAIRRDYNLTEVALALHTSQPGVSRQIRELEEELGVELFVRSGKRLTGLTAPGRHVQPIIEKLLLEADNLQRAGADFAQQDRGTLTIATTHTQARYALPAAVRAFRERWPNVLLNLHQGSPSAVAQMVRDGSADIGIATDLLTGFDDLVALPCYRWTYVAVVPRSHALARAEAQGLPLTLDALAAHPLITYDRSYTGRGHIDEAFARHGLAPQFSILAMNADVIKTYVEMGLGVGIVAAMAYGEATDPGLAALSAAHLFEPNTTHLAVRRGIYLREFAFGFIEAFAPQLTGPVVRDALDAPPRDMTLPNSTA